MARLPILGSDADQWGALLNEFLLVAHHADGTLKGTDPWVDARDYNQGGFTDVALNLALAAIGSTKTTLLLAAGIWSIGDNVVAPPNVTLMLVGGAELNIAAGKIVSINGPLVAAKTTIFAGAGAVVLGNFVDEVYPEWWQAEAIEVDGTGCPTVRKCDHMQKAIDTGKNVILSGTYDLGSTCTHGHAFLKIHDKHRQKIIGRNQAKLTCTTLAGGSDTDIVPFMIEITNSSFIEIDNILFEDSGVSTTSYLNVPRIGAAAVVLRVLQGGSETNNISLRNLYCKQLIHTIAVRDSQSSPCIHSITVDNVLSENVRYGLNFQENGDHVVVRNFRTFENDRDYIVYGVQFHDVEIYSKRPLSNGDTYAIARLQGGNTQNIKLRVRVEDKVSQETALVSLGHGQHEPSASALISDIDIDVDLRDADYGRIVEFRSADLNGVESTTINRWENIRIRGVDVNQNTVITWRTIPLTKVGIELSPLTYHFARLDNRSVNITGNFQGCYLVSGPGSRIYFSQGKLSENPVAIDLSQFAYQHSVLHLKVWALRGATEERNYREDTVFVYISDGALAVHGTNNVFNHFITLDAGVTYTTAGADFLVNFPNYNGELDDGAAVVEVAMY